MTARCDVLLVGTGLANALIAWRLAQARPDLSITMLERAERPFGDHTWSFHGPDAQGALHDLEPLVAHEWTAQRVTFPNRTRTLRASYHSLTSESVREAFARVANTVSIETDAHVTALEGNRAVLADGRSFGAPLVVDGTGFRPSPHLVLGYQKFVGLEIEVNGGHDEREPVIMDGTVEQIDSYRFVYTLPQSATRILVEDTHYADESELHHDRYREAALAYAHAKGWTGDVVREESGVLPIALAFDRAKFWADLPGPDKAVPVGMRAAFFQHITGYSFPLALEVANLFARAPVLTTSAMHDRVETYSRELERRQWYFRMLNRMMFRACDPANRYKLLQRFYGLPEPLIERFYGARLRKRDMLRIVSGKPPLPVLDALPALRERPLLRAEPLLESAP